jgi:DNA-binding winged helix-turn-helix (wHTH) protein
MYYVHQQKAAGFREGWTSGRRVGYDRRHDDLHAPWHTKGEVMHYTFGEYELDAQLYELRYAGTLLKIEPQVFNVLAYLIRHRDRTIPRQELLEQLWPDQYISDAVLSYCIMAARRAIGDSGRTQRSIKTVHGRGFRFVAPLQERGHEPPQTEAVTTSQTPGRAATPPTRVRLDTQAPADTRVTPGTDAAAVGAAALTTVLCATLADVATLAERLGFDALQRLRQAFFAMGQRLAQHHQGTLQFFGADGVLVLFGGEIAGGHHARRAVLAALELQQCPQTLYTDRSAPQIAESAIRMGLHTGPVTLDNLAGEQQLAVTTMGETLHLAVWLQYVAEPGTLLTSEVTMRLVQREVQYTAPREVYVPGQPRPVKAYTIHQIGA